MNRREFITGAAGFAIGAKLQHDNATTSSLEVGQESSPKQPSFPSTVAGVRLVDSKIARDATQLGREAYPPYLFNHAVRTFLFGSLIGKKLRQRFDEEVLYLACILHDLGLTDRFEGELPFEIQGAEAAKAFLERQKYAKDKLGIVWDGIAMHASVIGHYKQAEISLVGKGAGADIVGPDYSQISKTDVDEILKVFPRLELKDSFLKTCADVVRKHPGGATRSFMRDIGERYVPEFHPQNFCDLVIRAPFPE
jgi:HD domain